MDQLDYAHGNRRLRIGQTTVDSVGSFMLADHIPTQLRLAYVHSVLFRSSTPPGEEQLGPCLHPRERGLAAELRVGVAGEVDADNALEHR